MSYKIYSGTGTVYLRPVDADGNSTDDFYQVGDVQPLTVKVTTKSVEKKSRMVERAGQVIASKTEIDSIDGSMTLVEWNARNLAMGLSGSYVELTAASGEVSAASPESVTAPAAGLYAELAHRRVSDVVVKNSAEDTTYAEGTDYTIDETLGLISPVDGGGISEEDTIKVAYTYAAQTGYRVDIGSSTQIRVGVLAHLYDEYRDKDYILELDSVVLATDSEINFISEEDSEGEEIVFNMTLETLSGQSSPGRIDGVPI